MIWLFTCFLFGENLRTIDLKEPYPIQIRARDAGVQFDGSVLVFNKTQVYHFDADGRFILKFGSKGEEPEKFKRLTEVVWTGSHYVCADGRNRKVSVFAEDGTYLAHFQYWLRSLYHVNGQLLGQNIRLYIDKEYDGKPLIPFELDKNGVLSEKEPFHFISTNVPAYHNNFKEFFVASDEISNIYIMDVLDRDVTVYDKKLQERRRFDAELKHFTPSIDPWPRGIPREEYRRKMDEMSIVHQLLAVTDGLAISYWLAGSVKLSEPKMATDVVNYHGRFLREVHMPGLIIGSYQGKLYSLEEKEGLDYVLHIEQ